MPVRGGWRRRCRPRARNGETRDEIQGAAMKTPSTFLKLETLNLWIGGKNTPAKSSRTAEVNNPATGKVIRYVPMAGPSDVDGAVRAAQAALPAWRDTPPSRRARVMQRFLRLLQENAKAIAHIVSEEHGKTIPDALGSLER